MMLRRRMHANETTGQPRGGNKQSGKGIGAERKRTTLTTTLTSWDKISKNENFVKVEKKDLQAKGGPDGGSEPDYLWTRKD